jgi:hypothetical protein
MGHLKCWRRVGDGPFHKWETPGDELEGRWAGTHEGRYGPRKPESGRNRTPGADIVWAGLNAACTNLNLDRVLGESKLRNMFWRQATPVATSVES